MLDLSLGKMLDLGHSYTGIEHLVLGLFGSDRVAVWVLATSAQIEGTIGRRSA